MMKKSLGAKTPSSHAGLRDRDICFSSQGYLYLWQQIHWQSFPIGKSAHKALKSSFSSARLRISEIVASN